MDHLPQHVHREAGVAAAKPPGEVRRGLGDVAQVAEGLARQPQVGTVDVAVRQQPLQPDGGHDRGGGLLLPQRAAEGVEVVEALVGMFRELEAIAFRFVTVPRGDDGLQGGTHSGIGFEDFLHGFLRTPGGCPGTLVHNATIEHDQRCQGSIYARSAACAHGPQGSVPRSGQPSGPEVHHAGLRGRHA